MRFMNWGYRDFLEAPEELVREHIPRAIRREQKQ